VLFSSSEVAGFINETFEPAWQTLRPAPLVTIDFGDGHVVKRTLQGNVATYVCGPDGIVYDVLPGIYAPDVYLTQLKALKELFVSVRKDSTEAKTSTVRTSQQTLTRLRDYHLRRGGVLGAFKPQAQVQAVAQTGGMFKGGFGSGFGGQFQGQFSGQFQGQFSGRNVGSVTLPQTRLTAQVAPTGFGGGLSGTGGSFGGIEGPTERVIMGTPSLPERPAPRNLAEAAAESGATLQLPSTSAPAVRVPLAERSELALDSQVNEEVRRKAIHQELARVGAVRPDELKKWLFKEVLRVDLDDPLLGLGGVLKANYPFEEEDRALKRSQRTK
jgi:hypothetical protein